MDREVESREYVFGLTWEEQNDGRNRKVRVLLMRKDKLAWLADNNAERFEHDENIYRLRRKYRVWRRNNPEAPEQNFPSRRALDRQQYAKDRTAHLRKLYELYQKEQEEPTGLLVGTVYLAAPAMSQ